MATKYEEVVQKVAKYEIDICALCALTKAKKRGKGTKMKGDFVHIYREMELKNYPVVVVAVYGPNDDANVSEKDTLHDELTRLLDCINIRKENFSMGDINGRTESRADYPVIGRYGEVTVNNNGEL
ncbi:hypothetical protein HHI36_007614 [Cryptolaemus montrouzieri]|uniref:Craniofacial development protein 2-like n=1 Tax=Cryptolaemus montrouzieri TaxID=559131 RepID=A0ABD2MQ70_9CUCU